MIAPLLIWLALQLQAGVATGLDAVTLIPLLEADCRLGAVRDRPKPVFHPAEASES